MAYRWELDGPARLDVASLPEQVRQELDRFMEAVTIVDPADYGMAPGDPGRPVRTLAFGPHGEGLVTFLVYPPVPKARRPEPHPEGERRQADLAVLRGTHWLPG